MVKFIVEEDKIELEYYSDDATLKELADGVNEFRLTNELETKYCEGCGRCCIQDVPVVGLDLILLQKKLGLSLNEVVEKFTVLPTKPDLDARRKGVRDFMKTCDTDIVQASILYDYNQCEPLLIPRRKNGTCIFLQEGSGLCSIFEYRPFTGDLYVCNMGNNLSSIQEMVVRHGTWHAYYLLGWIEKEEIEYNPFLYSEDFDKMYVKDFYFNPEELLEKIFFYF